MVIDLNEVAKFDDIAPSWWNANSEVSPLHDINPLRVRFVANRIPLRGKEILDVGCGGGILSERIAFMGGQVTGIDPAKKTIQVAKLHAIESGIHNRVSYLCTTAEDLVAKKRAYFDVVIAMETLEHVIDPTETIQALSELCKPMGSVFIATINKTLQAYLMAIVAGEYITNMIPRGTHDYDKFQRPSDIARAMRNSGLVVKECAGFRYNPVTRYARLCEDVNVNYFIHAEKPATK